MEGDSVGTNKMVYQDENILFFEIFYKLDILIDFLVVPNIVPAEFLND